VLTPPVTAVNRRLIEAQVKDLAAVYRD